MKETVHDVLNEMRGVENDYSWGYRAVKWADRIEAAMGGDGGLSDGYIERQMTACMREADEKFRSVGGSTRHYVTDLLIPLMPAYGLAITAQQAKGSVSE